MLAKGNTQGEHEVTPGPGPGYCTTRLYYRLVHSCAHHVTSSPGCPGPLLLVVPAEALRLGHSLPLVARPHSLHQPCRQKVTQPPLAQDLHETQVPPAMCQTGVAVGAPT
jgi:hypothetical protein